MAEAGAPTAARAEAAEPSRSSEEAQPGQLATTAETVDERAPRESLSADRQLQQLVDTGISVDLNLETTEAETRQRPTHARKRQARRRSSPGERTVVEKARRAATGWRQETREARGKTTVGAGRSTAAGLHQVTESEGRIRGATSVPAIRDRANSRNGDCARSPAS